SAWLPRCLLALVAGWLLCPSAVDAARRTHYFETIGSADGLAQNTVHAIMRDERGFVWVATQGGLHRYDGYGFELFQHQPANVDSLTENFLTALAPGRDGWIWIGTNSSFLVALDLDN